MFLISLVVYLCSLFSSFCISLGTVPLPLLETGIVERKAFTDQLSVRFQDLSDLFWGCVVTELVQVLLVVSYSLSSLSLFPFRTCHLLLLLTSAFGTAALTCSDFKFIIKLWLHLFSVASKQGCQSYQCFESNETETSLSGNAQSNHDIECMVHSCFWPEGRSPVWEVSSLLSFSRSDSAGLDWYTKLNIFLFLLLGSLVVVVVSGCCSSPLVSYILAKIFWPA